MNPLPVLIPQRARGLRSAAEVLDDVLVGHGGAIVPRTGQSVNRPGRQGHYTRADMTAAAPRQPAGHDETSLAGRIRIAMATQGIGSQSELARRMKVNRQTVHKWLNGEVHSLESALLFRLSDVLNVNPRWLALHAGSPIKRREMTEETLQLVELYEALAPALRDAWVSSGNALLVGNEKPSKASPFLPPARKA